MHEAPHRTALAGRPRQRLSIHWSHWQWNWFNGTSSPEFRVNSADHSGRRSPEHGHAPDHATLANGLTVSVDAEEWKARAKMAGFLYDRLVSETADLWFGGVLALFLRPQNPVSRQRTPSSAETR